jgi:Na+-translocating ferredoxin:NAD+ oxidoreductase RNF subunit RnfB
MEVENMLPAVLSLALLGAVFGVVLAFASKRFVVEEDPRITAINDILPGANCGACGFPGCSALAVAISKGEAPVDACLPGISKAWKIAEIMGVEAKQEERMVSQLACCGGKFDSKDKYRYQGIHDCRAAVQLFGGHKACSSACLGLGTCVRVCPFGAVVIGANGLPVIDYDKCTGCGLCVSNCPKNVLHLVGAAHFIHVRCSNVETGKDARSVCKAACIKCGLCEKGCPQGAIKVKSSGEGRLAVIDYNKCTNCGICLTKCPTGAIGRSTQYIEEVAITKEEDPGSCVNCPISEMCKR